MWNTLWSGRRPGRLACLLVALLPACAWLGSGCRSPKGPGRDSLASVVVKVASPLDAARVVSAVFQEAGYKPVPLPANQDLRLVFEKPGGSAATVLYGDFRGNTVWYRLKVKMDILDGESTLLACDAYRVLDHGDAHFETEHKLAHAKKTQCRELLAKVKARLGAPANPK